MQMKILLDPQFSCFILRDAKIDDVINSTNYPKIYI